VHFMWISCGIAVTAAGAGAIRLNRNLLDLKSSRLTHRRASTDTSSCEITEVDDSGFST